MEIFDGPGRANRRFPRFVRPAGGGRAAVSSRNHSGGAVFNPLNHKGIPLDKQIRNWRELDVTPIDPVGADRRLV